MERLTHRCLPAVFWLMGLQPLPQCTALPRLLLSLLLRCISIVYIISFLRRGLSYVDLSVATSVGYTIGTFSMIFNACVCLQLLLESLLKYRAYARFIRLRYEAQLQLQRFDGNASCRLRGLRLWLFIVLLFGCDAVKSWANQQEQVSPVHLANLPLIWLQRFRYVQLLLHLIELHQRGLKLRRWLLQLAAINAPQSIRCNDIWQPYNMQEFNQLQVVRLSYDRIFECYAAFNDCYGWGILFMMQICIFDFVSNAYWVIIDAYSKQEFFAFFYNGATTLALGMLISALFWYGDASAENSRQIGCLISKLVKPLGNKRYNDLVIEFSLQALHQRFVVTAKDFFTLNLHTLSGMFAAVVTYLVILLQFMFAEKSSHRVINPLVQLIMPAPMNTTAKV